MAEQIKIDTNSITYSGDGLANINNFNILRGISDAWFHGSILRSKNITSYWTDGSLYDRINGTNGYTVFEDLFLGDYFTTGSSTINGDTRVRTWAIADFDYRLNVGQTGVTKHHVVLVPIDSSGNSADYLCSMKLYDSTPFTGAYYNTLACKAMISGGAITSGLQNIFGGHLLSCKELLSAANDSSGNITSSGWYSVYAVLPSEKEVFGSSSHKDTSDSSVHQLSLFKLSTAARFISSSDLWLRSIYAASSFSGVYRGGSLSYYSALSSNGVRPRFLIS